MGGGDIMDKNDVKKFIVSRRELVVFECLLSECDKVVEAVIKDSRYRALWIEFCGYDDSRAPVVAIEVEFAVSMD
jgi:hypothetical protein